MNIDECGLDLDTCHENAVCTDSIGSFECACGTGYAGDGFSCADVDECDLGTAGCASNAECSNNDGGFSCACLPGYLGDGLSCENIDECDPSSAVLSNCAEEATCVDMPGTYECVCPAGTSGDGTSCSTDSDGDGLPDAVEDPNGNGIQDYGETNLNDPDSDNDGRCDGNKSAPPDCVAGEDVDLDGQVGAGETDPLNPCDHGPPPQTCFMDSDGDGKSDAEEDINGNGIRDPNETDPYSADTDGDGICDGDIEVYVETTAGASGIEDVDNESGNKRLCSAQVVDDDGVSVDPDPLDPCFPDADSIACIDQEEEPESSATDRSDPEPTNDMLGTPVERTPSSCSEVKGSRGTWVGFLFALICISRRKSTYDKEPSAKL